MKRFNEMDETELLSLTDDQIMKLINYECALEGVPMLPPAPGAKPSIAMAEPDAQVFEIAGIFTMDSEHAIRILDAFNSGALYMESYPGSDYNTKYLEPLTSDKYGKPKIETKNIHSPEQWDKIKAEYAQISGKLKEWEKIDKEYSSALKERTSITDDVYGAILEARQHSYNRDCIRADFARYLELAEGNQRIALNFLEKVKDLSDFPELKTEFRPEEASDAT